MPAGGKILLNNARLHLKRGKRYGLCGPNGAGKSTLMRAISNGQLDGFPPKEELRTVRALSCSLLRVRGSAEEGYLEIFLLFSLPWLAKHPAELWVPSVCSAKRFSLQFWVQSLRPVLHPLAWKALWLQRPCLVLYR